MKAIAYSCILMATLAVSLQGMTQANTPRATFRLSGRITDIQSGEPLAAANIYIHDTRQNAISDGNGNYSFSRLSPGTLLIEISYTGYATLTQYLVLSSDTVINFPLAHEVAENQGVTVTAVSGAAQVRQTPVPITILRKDHFLKEASTNLVDALSHIPGVAQIATGPAISKPAIRGLSYNRVVVVNDGVRQEGQQWGDEHGTEVDEYAVNKAEIVKGPASIMYGSDALAGVVSFISATPPPDGTTRANLTTNYQSNNRLRAFHGDISSSHSGFVWGLNGTYKAAADYRNRYDGYVFNSKFRETDFSGFIGVNRPWGYAHVLASYFDQSPGLSEGDRDSGTGKFLKTVNQNGSEAEEIANRDDFISTSPFFPKQRIRHSKITSDNSFQSGKDRITLTASLQRNQREEFGNVLDPGERELSFDLQTFSYTAQYHWAEKNGWKTSVGINGMNQWNTNKGVEELIPAYSLFDLGGFIYARKTIGKLTWSGGARFDNRLLEAKTSESGKFDAFSKNFSNVSASAGLSYTASPQVVLKFNLARGFRAPSLPELASKGAHEGTNRYEYGEQDLRSEKSTQADAGIDWNSDHLSLSASLFANRVQDFIYYRKLESVNGGDSIIQDGGSDFFAFRFTQQNAWLYGGEVTLDIHPHPLDWLHIENSFSWVRGMLGEAQDGSRNLPFIPAPRLINELRGDFWQKGKHIRNGYLRIELDNTFAQDHPFTGYNTETATPGYSLLNLGLGADLRSRNRTWVSIYLAANNLTDVAYQSHLSRLKYAPVNEVTGRTGIYNMGKNFSIKLNFPLDFPFRKS